MTDPQHPQRPQAISWLLLATLFWGISFPLVKGLLGLHDRLVPHAGPWFSAVYTAAPRFLLATVLLIALRPRGFWRATASERKQGLGLGLFVAVAMLLQNDALQYTSASTSAFLTQVYAMLIPTWLAIRARRSPGGRVWLCGVLVLAGVAVLGNFNWHELSFGRGEAETLVCSLFFMGQILWLERPQFSANRPEKVTLVMFATQALLFWPLAVATAPDLATLLTPWHSPAWVGFTLALTLFCTIGSFSLMNKWQPKITATEAGLLYCVEPIFTAAMALFLPGLFSKWAGIDYPNETATWTLLVGGGLITLANVVLQLKPPAK